jgi:hypothetical protein
MIWAGHVACTWGIRNAHTIFAGKFERKRPLERNRNRCEDVKMYLTEIGFGIGIRFIWVRIEAFCGLLRTRGVSLLTELLKDTVPLS